MSNAQPGLIIEGKYRLLSPLGAGAMGAVWLAEQISVDRKVAIKLLHPSTSDTSGMNERFAIEAKAIARLNHPNCITLFDFGFSEELDSYFTVIEYVKGEPLGKRLLKNIMSIKESIEIVRQVAQGLDHAHFHNILHRDLKPDNIMLTLQSDGQELLKILDFGIAKIVNGKFGEEEDDEIRLTRAGDVFGTPAYMSPEQARSTRSLTPASDFYALGVIFFEMIEGELPFTASSSFDVLMMHVTDEVPRLQRKHLPPEIADVIYKLLEKHPDDRFQNGKDIIDALSSIIFEEIIDEVEKEPVGHVVAHTSIETEHLFASEDPTIPPASVLTITENRKEKRKSPLIFIFPAIAIIALLFFFVFQKGNNEDGKEKKIIVETRTPSALQTPAIIAPVKNKAVKMEVAEKEKPEKVDAEKAEKTPPKKILSQKKKRKATPLKEVKKGPAKKKGKVVNKKLQLHKLIKPESKVKKLGL